MGVMSLPIKSFFPIRHRGLVCELWIEMYEIWMGLPFCTEKG